MKKLPSLMIVGILILLVLPTFSVTSINSRNDFELIIDEQGTLNCAEGFNDFMIYFTDYIEDNLIDNVSNEDPETGYIQNTYMIEMRDGIKLATDVYLPLKISSPHGSILIRTPYNKDEVKPLGLALALIGWPTIIQDMRGRHASEGIDTVLRNAYTDGPDTLEWIASQSWSNGKVVTFGNSALGMAQFFMAGENPPELSCQFIVVATPNMHKHMVYQGGQFRKLFMENWLGDQGSSYILPELLKHENYTLDYWTSVSLDDDWQNVNVPSIHMGGWYDLFLQGTIDGYVGYQYSAGEVARGKSKLIIGPWTHEGEFLLKQGEITYPVNSLSIYPMLVSMFFEMMDQYAMDGDNGFDQRPAVSYYVMGDVDDPKAPGNEWRYAKDWPIPADYVQWYFQVSGALSKTLSANNGALTYTYDPSDPVPTIGGQNLYLQQGPYDQSSIENRDDILVFTSDLLFKPYEATGPIKARLFVSSDCPDTDFTVKLTDVYPDGRSMLITDGILRMRKRNGLDHWEFIESEEIYEIEVDLWSTSYVWNAGHKIRVAISSSNYPRFLNNPNTADAIYQNSEYNIAHNVIYFGNDHPSGIILPEIEQRGKSRNQPSSIWLDRFPLFTRLLDRFPLLQRMLSQTIFTRLPNL